jgi:hypothetical protein
MKCVGMELRTVLVQNFNTKGYLVVQILVCVCVCVLHTLGWKLFKLETFVKWTKCT